MNIKVQQMLNLNIHTSYFSHAVNYSHEYVTFWYVWNIRTTNFEILIGASFSQMSNFRRVKYLYAFVTHVKNLFLLFTCVTNTCEFFTSVTDSFKNWLLIFFFFVSLRYEKKTTCKLYGGRPPYENVHVGIFIHTSRKRKTTNCQFL